LLHQLSFPLLSTSALIQVMPVIGHLDGGRDPCLIVVITA